MQQDYRCFRYVVPSALGADEVALQRNLQPLTD